MLCLSGSLSVFCRLSRMLLNRKRGLIHNATLRCTIKESVTVFSSAFRSSKAKNFFYCHFIIFSNKRWKSLNRLRSATTRTRATLNKRSTVLSDFDVARFWTTHVIVYYMEYYTKFYVLFLHFCFFSILYFTILYIPLVLFYIHIILHNL